MSDKKLNRISEPDSDNWDVLQSLFLETPSSAPPASPSLDNWDELESIFGLGNDAASTNGNSSTPDEPEPPIIKFPAPDPFRFWWKWYWVLHKNGAIDPEALDFWLGSFTYFLITHFNPSLLPVHEQIKITLAAADRAKRTAEAASLKARIAQQTIETAKTKTEAAYKATENIREQAETATLNAQRAQQAIENIKTNAQEDARTIATAKTDAETAKLNTQRAQQAAEAAKHSTQQAQRVIESAKTNIQAVRSTIEATKTAIQTTAAETETAKVNAQRTYRAIDAAKTQAETAKLSTLETQQAAETARKRAETAWEEMEAILQTMKNKGVSPSESNPPINTSLLFEFLKKHKFKLLLGALALIPLLLFLSKVFSPKQPIQAYVNPITGNDANAGTAATPFRTLSHALQQSGTGSEIYLAKGDYRTERSLTIPANTTLVIQPFNDIDGHWAAPFIRALATQGLIAGYPDGSFQPDANLTRAEYSTLLTKGFNLPEVQSVNLFIDVSPDFWAYPSIQSTYSKAFLKGFPEGDFKPNDNVQRVHVISALVSGLGLAPTNSENTLSIYQDRSSIPPWASAQVATATTAKLIANYPNLQQLNPTQSATRAETVVMMYQALVKQGKMSAIESPYLVKQ